MTMADTEDVVVIAEEEEYFSADETRISPPPPREEASQTPLPPDVMEELAQITHKLEKFKERKNPEIEDALKLFINEWRHQTKEEIEDLRKLKDRVTVRKSQRAEEEARFAEMKREEEEMRIRFVEEERTRKQEEKLKRLQVAELKRQKMMEEQSKGRNFKIASTARDKANTNDLTRELSKEEYEVMKGAALSVIIKPMEIGGLGKERLKRRGQEMWDKLVLLETERYDLEERRARQDYDLRELKERQRQQLRAKALKLGLEPEALTGKYPPKIRVASKYEKRSGLLPFGETKGLFEGGFLEEYHQKMNDDWMRRQDIFTKRNPDDLPPWLADMPRQILKQIEAEEAIQAAILKEEVEAKQPPSNDDDAGENVEEGDEGAEEDAEGETETQEGGEDAEEKEEGAEDEGVEDEVEKTEIVITDEATPASEEQVEEEAEEVEEEEEEEAEEVASVAATEETAADEEEIEEAEPEQASPAKQQEEEVEEEEEEEEEEVEVVPEEEAQEDDEV